MTRPQFFLTTLLLLLAAALTWLWVTPHGQMRSEVHWSEPQALRNNYDAMLPALPAVAPVDAARFLVLLEKPLFSLTRRPPLPPPPPKPVEAPPPPDSLSGARLQAIFDVPGQGGSVILLIAGKSRRVNVKAAVDGWTLQGIDGRNVTFVRGGQSRQLQLQRGALTTYGGLGAPQTVGVAPAPGAASTAPRRAAPLVDQAAVAAPAQAASAPLPRPMFGGGRR